jgi:acyl carrier protein
MSETKDEIMAAVTQIFTEVTDVAANDVRLEKTLRDELDVDSLTMAELGVALQDRFDIELSDDQVVELETVADVVAVIYGAQVAA